MPDATIATSLVSGAVGGAFTAIVGAIATTYTTKAETRRQHSERRAKRRGERQETYQTAIDLLTELGWRWGDDPEYEVVRDFNLPFLRAANRVRVYGSPASIAAVDEIQEGLARWNRAERDSEREAANQAIRTGHDHLVMAARADVGPRTKDGLADVPYRQGAGPSA
jgi:hypothetical protein